jgi:hypothetical protein
MRDFEPISLLTFAPMLIVAKNEMPAKEGVGRHGQDPLTRVARRSDHRRDRRAGHVHFVLNVRKA